jgi:predicted PolB exonuclease-like 3'-5' exonuclease
VLRPLDHLLVWDLETVPDLAAVARVHGRDEGDEAAAREKLGDAFPKLIFHRIVCVGALIAERVDGVWTVRSLGAPNLSERTEAELLQSFVDRIAEYRPQLITFNGASFDLPVLRYRAMINRVTAPGLSARSYWHRFTDDALDLCDVLACYAAGAKISLQDLCRALGFRGKLDGMDGGEVDGFVREGRIAEVSAYCEIDVVSTYRVWLRYELFRGGLSRAEYEGSEENLLGFLADRVGAKPHLAHVLGAAVSPTRAACRIPDAGNR